VRTARVVESVQKTIKSNSSQDSYSRHIVVVGLQTRVEAAILCRVVFVSKKSRKALFLAVGILSTVLELAY